MYSKSGQHRRYTVKTIIGWLLTISTVIMLVFGIISSIHFRLRGMSVFELITILVLGIGGIGLFLSSLHPSRSKGQGRVKDGF